MMTSQRVALKQIFEMNLHSVSKHFMWKRPFQSHFSQVTWKLHLLMYFQTYCAQLQQKHIASFSSQEVFKMFQFFIFKKSVSDSPLSTISFLLPSHWAPQRKNNPTRNLSKVSTFCIPSCKFAKINLKILRGLLQSFPGFFPTPNSEERF